jgi:regulator of replication initiation timing
MSPAAEPSDLPRPALEAEVAALRAEVAELKQLVSALRDENARLKGAADGLEVAQVGTLAPKSHFDRVAQLYK